MNEKRKKRRGRFCTCVILHFYSFVGEKSYSLIQNNSSKIEGNCLLTSEKCTITWVVFFSKCKKSKRKKEGGGGGGGGGDKTPKKKRCEIIFEQPLSQTEEFQLRLGGPCKSRDL